MTIHHLPAVALESTVISHGLPYPQNITLAQEMEEIVRQGGAEPRTVAILEKLRPPGCEPDGDGCCFRRHLGLEKAIDNLRERVGPKR